MDIPLLVIVVLYSPVEFPDEEYAKDIGYAEETAAAGQSGCPGFQPPWQLLHAAVAVLHAGYEIPAFKRNRFEGVDEVIRSIGPAAPDIFLDLFENPGSSGVCIPSIDEVDENFVKFVDQDITLLDSPNADNDRSDQLHEKEETEGPRDSREGSGFVLIDTECPEDTDDDVDDHRYHDDVRAIPIAVPVQLPHPFFEVQVKPDPDAKSESHQGDEKLDDEKYEHNPFSGDIFSVAIIFVVVAFSIIIL